MVSMRRPIFVCPISDQERKALEDGLRSSDAFVLRRCQVLLASARGENAYQIARSLGCGSQTARTAIKRFNEGGLQEALRRRSSRPKTIRAAFDGERTERLREMLHRSPREFGKPTSLWTLALAAEVSFEEGITEERVSAETVRASLERMGVRWLRAKSLDHQPRSRVRKKKRLRDRLIRLSEGEPGWVVGFEDEVWWSRVAPPLAARLERGRGTLAPAPAVSRQRRPGPEGYLLLWAVPAGA